VIKKHNPFTQNNLISILAGETLIFAGVEQLNSLTIRSPKNSGKKYQFEHFSHSDLNGCL